MAAFHGYHANPHHPPNHLFPLLHPLHTTLHQQPPLANSSLPFQHTPRMANAKLSVACMDRLEAAMTKLAAAQLRFAATQASMESKLDALLLKLPIPITSHHFPCRLCLHVLHPCNHSLHPCRLHFPCLLPTSSISATLVPLFLATSSSVLLLSMVVQQLLMTRLSKGET